MAKVEGGLRGAVYERKASCALRVFSEVSGVSICSKL